jgi:enamine deaminase RidA (YjgF/YER057c/UK114 family)
MSAEQQIIVLGIELPITTAPAGNYVSARQSGNFLFTSGRAPLSENGAAIKGKLGREFTAENGYLLARSACVDLLAVLKHQLGSLDEITRVIELNGSINATPEFEEHAKVMDGASDLLVQVFGSIGIHVRSVIGVSSHH